MQLARIAAVALVVAVLATVPAAAHAPTLSTPPAFPVPAAAAKARPPVVMIVFDEFPSDALLGPDGNVDAGRFPNFARLARMSAWFPNATTVADWTWRAVPAILDGRLPRKGTGSRARGHPNSLFRLLKNRGYAIRSTEEITSLCPYRGCRHLRSRGFIKIIRSGRFERLDATIRSIRPSRRPTLTFHHSVLPHQPWVHLPSGRRHQEGIGDFGLGTTGPPGFDDEFLTAHSEQRFLLQLGALDRKIGALLGRLERTRMLDRSLLVVTADHGISFDRYARDRRLAIRENVGQVATVPLFMKLPGQRAGVVDRSYVQSIDVFPTIAGILGARVRGADGRPVWHDSVRRRRRIVMIKRKYEGRLRIATSSLEAQRAANVARRLRTFGWGSWSRVFAIGPHQELLGKAVRGLPQARAGRVHAQLQEPGRVRSVRRRSGFVPASVTGRIDGAARGATRDVAVALNGRVVAVGRTFQLRGRRGERFSLMIPEESLREGRNVEQIFEVRGDDQLRLVPLATVR